MKLFITVTVLYEYILQCHLAVAIICIAYSLEARMM